MIRTSYSHAKKVFLPNKVKILRLKNSKMGSILFPSQSKNNNCIITLFCFELNILFHFEILFTWMKTRGEAVKSQVVWRNMSCSSRVLVSCLQKEIRVEKRNWRKPSSIISATIFLLGQIHRLKLPHRAVGSRGLAGAVALPDKWWCINQHCYCMTVCKILQTFKMNERVHSSAVGCDFIAFTWYL